MHRPSPLVIQVVAPFAGRTVALSLDPDDCRLILRRLASRKRREAREILDPATAAVLLTEADRYEQLIVLVDPDHPTARRAPATPTETPR